MKYIKISYCDGFLWALYNSEDGLNWILITHSEFLTTNEQDSFFPLSFIRDISVEKDSMHVKVISEEDIFLDLL